MFTTVLNNVFTQGILPDQSRSLQGKACPHLGEIEKYIVGRTTGPLRLVKNIGELFVLGININDLYLINDPISSGKHSGAGMVLGI